MKHLLAFAQLIRIPTVFTCMADIFLGYLMVSDGFEPISQFLFTLLASCCLYWSGMIFNDLFDIEQDRRERPTRPIPSGRIPWSVALVLGIGFMLTGLIVAATLSQLSLLIAIALAACIFLYNCPLKKTVVGPLFMGSCRTGNILLGVSVVVTEATLLFRLPHLGVAICMGLYIVGLTWFARSEAATSRRQHLLGGAITVNLAFLGLMAFTFNSPTAHLAAIALLGYIAFMIDRRLWPAIQEPSGPLVGAGIKTMLLSLIMIDATLVYAFGPPDLVYPLLTASLLIPAFALSRLIAMT